MANTRLVSKPFLRWAGSKKKLLRELEFYYTEQHRYIEPFAGSAQLFFHLSPPCAVLGDINKELVSCYNVIKENPTELYEILCQMPINKQHYYTIRDDFNDVNNTNALRKAAQFIYLNRLSFNGLFRTNKIGKYNVPYGGEKSGNFPSKEDLALVSDSLKNTQIHHSDFDSLVRNNLNEGDFVYLDPPYTIKNQRIFKQYNPTVFGSTDIERICDILDFIDGMNAKFLLSYAFCDDVAHVAQKWTSKVVSTQRNIAGFSSNRKMEKEFLISNF